MAAVSLSSGPVVVAAVSAGAAGSGVVILSVVALCLDVAGVLSFAVESCGA